MTRKEEIEKEAFNYINSDAVNPTHMQLAFGDFINGAKYADKTMLDRACEWLELRISVDVPVETNKNGEPLADSLFDKQMKRAKLAEEFIADFRKAMEGE